MLMLGLGVGTLARWVPQTPPVVELCYFHSFDKGSPAFPLSLGANVKAERLERKQKEWQAT